MIGILIGARSLNIGRYKIHNKSKHTARENKATQLQIISALWIMLLKYTGNKNSAAIISKPTYSHNFINKPVNIFQSKL